MPKQTTHAIRISENFPMSEVDELVVHVAYTLWVSAPFRCGLPEEAFKTAIRLVKGRIPAKLFLVPKPDRPSIPIQTRCSGGPNDEDASCA